MSVSSTPASVTLRRAIPADAERLLAWRREPSASRFQPLKQRTADDLRQDLAAGATGDLDATFAGSARFVIVAGDEDAGWVSLSDIDRDHGTASVGYTIGERFRGRGIATAGVGLVVDLAFGPLGLGRLGAVAAVDNIASRRVLERCGFTLEGIARGYLVISGQRVDHATYGLLATDCRHSLSRRSDQDR